MFLVTPVMTVVARIQPVMTRAWDAAWYQPSDAKA